jgi:hypothetical protein
MRSADHRLLEAVVESLQPASTPRSSRLSVEERDARSTAINLSATEDNTEQ